MTEGFARYIVAGMIYSRGKLDVNYLQAIEQSDALFEKIIQLYPKLFPEHKDKSIPRHIVDAVAWTVANSKEIHANLAKSLDDAVAAMSEAPFPVPEKPVTSDSEALVITIPAKPGQSAGSTVAAPTGLPNANLIGYATYISSALACGRCSRTRLTYKVPAGNFPNQSECICRDCHWLESFELTAERFNKIRENGMEVSNEWWLNKGQDPKKAPAPLVSQVQTGQALPSSSETKPTTNTISNQTRNTAKSATDVAADTVTNGTQDTSKKNEKLRNTLSDTAKMQSIEKRLMQVVEQKPMPMDTTLMQKQMMEIVNNWTTEKLQKQYERATGKVFIPGANLDEVKHSIVQALVCQAVGA